MLKEISNHFGPLYAIFNEDHCVLQKDEDFSFENLLQDIANSQLDFCDMSEPYCLSNYDMAVDFENAKDGKTYIVPLSLQEEYAQGKEILIWAAIKEEGEK